MTPPLTPSSPSTKPYRMLDAVRGLASVWVVFFHAALLMSLFHPAVAQIPWIKTIFLHGYLGVPVFFVVSGYCIANAAVSALRKPRPLPMFAVARLRRIFPPCWASLLLFAAAAFFAAWLAQRGSIGSTSLSRIDLGHQSLRFYFANLTLTQLLFSPHEAFLSEVCWTLCYEIAFYVVVALFLLAAYWLLRRATDRAPAAARAMLNGLHLFTLACAAALLIAPHLLQYPLDLWVQFGLGIAVFDALRRPRSRPALAALALLCLLVALFLFHTDIPLGSNQQSSRLTFSTALVAALLLFACRRLDDRLAQTRSYRAVAFIGDFSYSLYLINFLAVSALMTLYRPLHLSAAMDIPMIFLIVFLTLPIAYVFYRLFEKPFISASAPAPPPATCRIYMIHRPAIRPRQPLQLSTTRPTRFGSLTPPPSLKKLFPRDRPNNSGG